MTWGEQNSQEEAFQQMDYAVEKGINFFDTAELYSVMPRKETYGKTEEIIGNWFQHKKNRKDIILASKIASKSEGLEWIRKGSKYLGFDKTNFNDAIDQSLKRLKTDYIDLYQLHWPERKVPKFGVLDFEYDPSDQDWTPIEQVLDNLQDLINSGKIRYVGLSNETPWGVMNFMQLYKDKNLPRMMSIQNPYSLLNRSYEVGLAEVSIREQIGCLSYSPLASGYLSGKYRNGAMPKGSRIERDYEFWGRYRKPQSENAIEEYYKISKKYNLDMSQMAIKFCEIQDFMTSVIIGATTMDQLKTNIESCLLYTSPSPRDLYRSRMPSSA